METLKLRGRRLIIFSLVAAALILGMFSDSCKDYTGAKNENLVKVKLSDNKLELLNEKPIGPGLTVFEVTNEGKTEHGFVIEGADGMQRLEENLQPGETRAISVELEPSVYKIYCPIDDHRSMGMASVIRITEPGGGDDESGK